MRILGFSALGMMGLVGAVVAVRLLFLARRTRALPELSMGAGLLCLTVLGAPLTAAGRLPHLVATPMGDALFGTGLALAELGLGLLFVFTWQVFRPALSLARVGTFAVYVTLGVIWIGLMRASSRGSTLAEILPHTKPWAMAVIGMIALAFLWTGLESLAYHLRMRRRLALGLADPVLADRFLLWSLAALAAVAMCGVVVAAILMGRAPMQDPLAQVSMGLASVVVSVAWYLAFFPPERYMRRLRRRAGVPELP